MIIPIVQQAAETIGGLTRLAEALGVRYPTFHSWRKIPAERVLDMERVTGISRHQLRPDLYPDEVQRAANDGRVTPNDFFHAPLPAQEGEAA